MKSIAHNLEHVKHLIETRTAKGANGCWIWMGAINKRTGYGFLHLRKPYDREEYAHRAAYMVFVGDIPDDMEIDHLCKNKACCNPAHLEVVTHKENMHRSTAMTGGSKTHCKYGHEFTPENTRLLREGKRQCLACYIERYRSRYKKKGAPRHTMTHCHHGHEFTPENTYYPPSGHKRRMCRQCMRASHERRKAREAGR